MRISDWSSDVCSADLALVYAIKELATHGPTSATMLIAASGLACGIAFVRRMLVRRNPMLDVRLFTNPVFSVALMVNLVSIFALVGSIYFLAPHLPLIAGHSPLEAALMMVTGMVVTVVLGLASVPFVRPFGGLPVLARRGVG